MPASLRIALAGKSGTIEAKYLNVTTRSSNCWITTSGYSNVVVLREVNERSEGYTSLRL